MTEHKVGTREEWLRARQELLEREKELTRRNDELARQRRELPWLRVDKEYGFETDEGTKALEELFAGRSQLLVYHTYSTYARGLEIMLGFYALLDRAPKGRNEGDPPEMWIRRHDEYEHARVAVA